MEAEEFFSSWLYRFTIAIANYDFDKSKGTYAIYYRPSGRVPHGSMTGQAQKICKAWYENGVENPVPIMDAVGLYIIGFLESYPVWEDYLREKKVFFDVNGNPVSHGRVDTYASYFIKKEKRKWIGLHSELPLGPDGRPEQSVVTTTRQGEMDGRSFTVHRIPRD